MFDSKDIEKYRSVKAPEGLFERIAQDASAPKKTARVIETNRFLRSASAIAACFLLVMTLTFALGRESDLYICVGGEELSRAGETMKVGDVPATLARLAEAPMGIPFTVSASERATVTLEGGELWTVGAEGAMLVELPYTAEKGEVLYLLPEADKISYLTLTENGKSVTYTVSAGEDPAEAQITFEKQ